MAKNIYRLIIISILATLACCSSDTIDAIVEPEQVGKQVYEILKDASTITKSEYISKFISLEELKEMGRNDKIVKDYSTRGVMLFMSLEELNSRIEKEYNGVKSKAGKNGVKWSDIEYLDFVYKFIDDNGFKVCKGELYFKVNGQSFKVETSSFWNGTEYLLYAIRDFKKS